MAPEIPELSEELLARPVPHPAGDFKSECMLESTHRPITASTLLTWKRILDFKAKSLEQQFVTGLATIGGSTVCGAGNNGHNRDPSAAIIFLNTLTDVGFECELFAAQKPCGLEEDLQSLTRPCPWGRSLLLAQSGLRTQRKLYHSFRSFT